MIEDIVKSIAEAEAKAEELQKEALAKGKELVLQAEKESDRMRKEMLADTRNEGKATIADAENKANESSKAIMAEGEKRAAQLEADTAKAAATAAEFIVEKLVEKYVAG